MFDPVPWFVGGGAQHSPEVARLLAYASLGGAEGVVSPGDCRVAPLDTPTSKVRVLVGAIIALNRAAGGAQQSYVARNPTETVVDIAATGSGSGRSDLIVARIEDSHMPGEPWQDPADVTVGPYVFVRVISNVNAATTKMPSGQTGVVLARVDIPANTTVITAAMIKDLRSLARPRSERQNFVGSPTPGVTMQNLQGAVWPDYRPIVSVPNWATEAYVTATLSSIGQRVGPAQGIMTTVLGGGLNGITGYRAINIGYDLDAPVTQGSRHTLVVGGAFTDVRGIAGKDVYVQMEAQQQNPGPNNGYLITVAGTQVLWDVQFYERRV